MAKRKTLAAPSAEDLARIEGEFRRETPARGLMAPIAQVAGDAAALASPRSAADRALAERDRADAERLREALGKGLVLREIPTAQIDADAMVRDRMTLVEEEMTELKLSIAANGLRLPVEVFELAGAGADGPRYGLLSGYRRLRAVQELRAVSGQVKYDTIRAILRDPAAMGGAFAAMVEENEIRAGLSHFERGRIAVIAAQQGAFASVEAAVEALFPAASKGKRSKIRSFALVFEELGDMLAFPEALREKDGLRLAGILREGGEAALRDALAAASPASAAEEWVLLDAALAQIGPAVPHPERGGRPASRPVAGGRQARLDTGVTLTSGHDGRHWFIRFEGKRVDADLVDTMMRELERLVGPV